MLENRVLRFVCCAAIAATVVSAGFVALADESALERDFRSPPHEARPHAWYYIMNGNATKEGVTADFEALARIGMGGVQMSDVGCGIPPGPLAFASPAWFDLFRHAAKEARRLGLELGAANCSGWSSSGGPWNMPSNGMKVVTWRETRARGPAKFHARLPRDEDDHGFYEDIAVLAFPTPAAELTAYPDVKTTIDGMTFTLASKKPFTANGLSFRLSFLWTWSANATVEVEVSGDGAAFRPLESFSLPLARLGNGDRSLRCHAFKSPVTARAIRATVSVSGVKATLVEAHPEARMEIENLKSKIFEVRQAADRDTAVALPGQVVAKESVRNLVDRLAADGTLDWDVPAGDWTIVRLGCKCNGHRNHPTSEHGIGLEVDKLSAAAADWHFDQYIGALRKALGPLAGDVRTGFNNVFVDSYEVGSQNWTRGLAETFERRRGYSIVPYLPVFAGRIVDSVDVTERFLEDFRRVVADLFAENYAGALRKKCHACGLRLSIEPYGSCPADDLQYGEYADIPMGEYWSRPADGDFYVGDDVARIAGYVAHVWGKRYAATESFTGDPSRAGGRWRTTPFSIKAQGDRVYTRGVNRIIYHRFVHQPWANSRYLPGMTMGRWGMHFDRTQTWWDFASGWIAYQSRCQAMLQAGTFVADALFFCGEQVPNLGGVTYRGIVAEMSLPPGYASDICPTDALLKLRVEDGRVVVPGGVRYALLALPPSDTMSARVLAKVDELVSAGAKVCCTRKPVRSFGLVGYPEADGEVAAAVDRIWAKGVMTCSPVEALKRLGVAPDFETSDVPMEGPTGATCIHRRQGGDDWYFVALPNREPVSFEASFRETGRVPEIWDAETGRIADADVWRVEKGRTVVRLDFNVSGSAFVVFRRPAAGEPAVAVRTVCGASQAVDGPWRVRFPHGFAPNPLAEGADETVVFPSLLDWSKHPLDGVRYFSGTATYEKSVTLDDATAKDLARGGRLLLDLGEVRHFAEVTVNGRTYPAFWKPPFSLDVTEAVRFSDAPALDLRIRVANLWANRLIGDDRLCAPDCEWVGEKSSAGVKEIVVKEIPQWVKEGRKSPTGRVTFTTWKHWDKDDELQPSGLLGPVRLRVLVPSK